MENTFDNSGFDPIYQRRVGRKLFLGLLGVGAAGVASGSLLAPVVGGLKAVTRPSSAVPGFTIYTVAPIPSFHPATWRLSVGGMVSHPLSLSYNDLLNLPALSVVRQYQCVTGWIVPNCHWQGVSLRTLARVAGASPNAKFINFYSMDGVYSESLRMPSQAFKPDVMLGYYLNGKPLAAEQGLPLRLVVPEMYGYKYAKWINRVEFSDRQEIGYWENNGYTVDAYLGTE
jgi:DMSO/TMAO reductase YedYZ molybdopterin-dependent catalytic subunit